MCICSDILTVMIRNCDCDIFDARCGHLGKKISLFIRDFAHADDQMILLCDSELVNV